MDFTSSRWFQLLATVLVFLIGGAWFLWREGPDIRHQVKGYSLAEAVDRTTDAAGEGARVLSVLDQEKNYSLAVLTADGRVLERFYGEVCTSSARGNHCTNRERRHEHRAGPGERRAARVGLGELDAGVPQRMRRHAGVPQAVSVGLRGGRWIVAAPTPEIAGVDGSGQHPARSASERALARTVATDEGLR